MATELTVVEAPSAYEQDTSLTPVNPGFVAADAVNGNSFRATGRELLLVDNPTGGPLNISVTSQPASRTGRSGDITTNPVAAGTVAAFQFFPRDGWESGGLISLLAASASLRLAVIRYPLQAAG